MISDHKRIQNKFENDLQHSILDISCCFGKFHFRNVSKISAVFSKTAPWILKKIVCSFHISFSVIKSLDHKNLPYFDNIFAFRA
eukprot:TRINITY_DN12773_c0_g1_i2.p2 TRINITY_DN12773_c0_g1~~TRINITY_DN12773_c0_g1_i2.p2  ORF type:complete len:84 (-),score=12.26 TRINITY_DN12773_c0_g1_i2:192-443(-)